METNNTWAQMAQRALDVQNACNLRGVLRSFRQELTRLDALGVADINAHPVTQLWADKVASLAGVQNLSGDGAAQNAAWCWAVRTARRADG